MSMAPLANNLCGLTHRKSSKISTSPSSRNRAAGFTLIEMLVVAPIMIILIGVMIVMISSVTGDSLQARARNTAVYQTQDALDGINAEIARATALLTTTGTLTSPQGSNGSTAAFNASTSVLILKTPATSANPINSVREPIYYDSPSSCTSASVTSNDPYPVTSVYFVSSGTLWKRTILPATTTGTPCSTPWQRASCAISATLTGVCKAYDEKLAEGVTSFSIQYLNKTGATVAIGNIQTQAKAANVTLATSKTVAGKTIAYQASTLARASNIRFSTTTTTPQTFTYTGSAQTWTVPTGVTSVTVECWGAQGGGNTGEGGRGGYAKGTLNVSSGDTLNIYVGGQGGTYTTGGWNGGGNGSYSSGYYGGKGGGASDVRVGGTALTNRVIVAGGGGGSYYNGSNTYSGTGGGLTGGQGAQSTGNTGYGGTGGSQSTGGTYSGALGLGGAGSGNEYTGGGGGGYYGGGGGSGYSMSGGGGSGYIGGVTNGTMTSGSRSGDGQVKITYSITTSDSPYED